MFAMSAYCRGMSVEVGFVSGRVRCGNVSVGTCSAMSGYCRDVFDEVGLVSGRVRRGLVKVERF